MNCSNIARNGGVQIAVASTIAVGLITMLACGILGRMGKLSIPPAGARAMIAIPATVAGIGTAFFSGVGCYMICSDALRINF